MSLKKIPPRGTELEAVKVRGRWRTRTLSPSTEKLGASVVTPTTPRRGRWKTKLDAPTRVWFKS